LSDLELLLKRRKREEASVKTEEGRPNKDEGRVQTLEHPTSLESSLKPLNRRG